jgi:hypothetical protein
VGRALTWADPRVIELAKNSFVPVAADDWYQRRRADDEGEFFRKVADQGPRKGQGGSTRQGIYVFSAGGVLLGYRNHHDPDVMHKVLLDSLKAWQKLPARDRIPKGVQVGDPTRLDRQYHRELPKGGQIVNVHTRILDRTSDGEYCHGTCKFTGGDKAAQDHLWLLPEDVQALVPGNIKVGERRAVSQRLAMRIVRFHLVDNTRGEPSFWRRDQVSNGKLQTVVEKIDGDTVTLKLEGHYLLTAKSASAKEERGFDVRLLGYLRYNTATKAFDAFDVVALGDHWGEGPYTRGSRPGRMPLGVAFVLSRGNNPADRVPPQAAREWQEYVHAEK